MLQRFLQELMPVADGYNSTFEIYKGRKPSLLRPSGSPDHGYATYSGNIIAGVPHGVGKFTIKFQDDPKYQGIPINRVMQGRFMPHGGFEGTLIDYVIDKQIITRRDVDQVDVRKYLVTVNANSTVLRRQLMPDDVDGGIQVSWTEQDLPEWNNSYGCHITTTGEFECGLFHCGKLRNGIHCDLVNMVIETQHVRCVHYKFGQGFHENDQLENSDFGAWADLAGLFGTQELNGLLFTRTAAGEGKFDRERLRGQDLALKRALEEAQKGWERAGKVQQLAIIQTDLVAKLVTAQHELSQNICLRQERISLRHPTTRARLVNPMRNPYCTHLMEQPAAGTIAVCCPHPGCKMPVLVHELQSDDALHAWMQQHPELDAAVLKDGVYSLPIEASEVIDLDISQDSAQQQPQQQHRADPTQGESQRQQHSHTAHQQPQQQHRADPTQGESQRQQHSHTAHQQPQRQEHAHVAPQPPQRQEHAHMAPQQPQRQRHAHSTVPLSNTRPSLGADAASSSSMVPPVPNKRARDIQEILQFAEQLSDEDVGMLHTFAKRMCP